MIARSLGHLQIRPLLRPVITSLLCAAAFAAPLQAQTEAAVRVVSVGGAVTEIVYALGEQDRLVARDTTSNHPEAALDLPDVGYIRALSPEGVMSVSPDLILTEEGAGPPESVEILRHADIPFAEVPDGFTAQAVLDKIRAVGTALEVPEKAEALAAKVAADMQAAQDSLAARVDIQNKRVLFVLSMQGGRILASGSDTAADGMIRLVGAQNAVTSFSGYKPLTDEAVAQAAPDVILMMDRQGDHAALNDQLFANPAISTTPAARSRAVVRMDGMYLLGFSVRTPDALRDLAAALSTALDGG